jgi:hypothetical protein
MAGPGLIRNGPTPNAYPPKPLNARINPPYDLPINGTSDVRPERRGTASITETALKREDYWRYWKGKPQEDAQRDVNFHPKAPSWGPIVL